MPKGLLIKGTKSIVRYDDRYASDPRFEVVEDVAAYLDSQKAAPQKRRTRRKKVAQETVEPVAVASSETELDELIAGMTSGEEDDQ